MKHRLSSNPSVYIVVNRTSLKCPLKKKEQNIQNKKQNVRRAEKENDVHNENTIFLGTIE